MIIYSMLVLFIECWGSNLSIQAGVGNLNGDLHQLSGIKYESRSFSVRCLVSLAYRKGLISGVKLSIVVPQAIGISLRIKFHASIIVLFFLFETPFCCWLYGVLNSLLILDSLHKELKIYEVNSAPLFDLKVFIFFWVWFSTRDLNYFKLPNTSYFLFNK